LSRKPDDLVVSDSDCNTDEGEGKKEDNNVVLYEVEGCMSLEEGVDILEKMWLCYEEMDDEEFTDYEKKASFSPLTTLKPLTVPSVSQTSPLNTTFRNDLYPIFHSAASNAASSFTTATTTLTTVPSSPYPSAPSYSLSHLTAGALSTRNRKDVTNILINGPVLRRHPIPVSILGSVPAVRHGVSLAFYSILSIAVNPGSGGSKQSPSLLPDSKIFGSSLLKFFIDHGIGDNQESVRDQMVRNSCLLISCYSNQVMNPPTSSSSSSSSQEDDNLKKSQLGPLYNMLVTYSKSPPHPSGRNYRIKAGIVLISGTLFCNLPSPPVPEKENISSSSAFKLLQNTLTLLLEPSELIQIAGINKHNVFHKIFLY
jgi:hypothetical protein